MTSRWNRRPTPSTEKSNKVYFGSGRGTALATECSRQGCKEKRITFLLAAVEKQIIGTKPAQPQAVDPAKNTLFFCFFG